MKNTFEWTNPTGTQLKLEIAYSEKIVDVVLNSDGYIINTEKKEIKVNSNLELYVNGKKNQNCSNVNFWKIIDITNAELIKKGLTKKIWGLNVVFTSDVAVEIEKFINDFIVENKNDEVVAAEKIVSDKKKEAEIKRAKEIISKAEKQSDIPTNKVARAREKAYNDFQNEGGEGYVPHIIDIDEYNRSLKIVNL